MATFNRYAAIFRKLKYLLSTDERTSFLSYYGAEYSKKKTLPAVMIFPENKLWDNTPGERDLRKTSIPKKVYYIFNLWFFVSLHELEDSYYNESTDSKAGLTQIATEVEAVIKANKTGLDLIDTSIRLWTDMEFSDLLISQKPGKLMHGKFQVKFVSKELA